MTRTRLIFILFLISFAASLALFIPGWFKDPRKMVQGDWQEFNKLGCVEVTDCTARWQGSNYKATFRYEWVQTDDEPYTLEISRNNEKWLIGVTFETDDLAEVDFYIMDKLPPEARDFIQQKNKARNRPENELKMRFRRITPEK